MLKKWVQKMGILVKVKGCMVEWRKCNLSGLKIKQVRTL